MHHSDPVRKSIAWGRQVDGFTPNQNLAFGFVVVTRKNVGDHRLARTVLAQKRVDFARANIEIQVIQDQVFPDTRESLGQPASLQEDLPHLRASCLFR